MKGEPDDDLAQDEKHEEGYWEDDQNQAEQWTWTDPEADKEPPSKESDAKPSGKAEQRAQRSR